ncbi:MAG: PfkB family carbohydrate kinase, partial [Acidimicrobiia bacterium]
ELLRLGAKVVVLKLGAEGALVADPVRRVRLPGHAVELVDATGAGDCFDGAFLARVAAGDDPVAAARYANAAAALSVTGRGAVARGSRMPGRMGPAPPGRLPRAPGRPAPAGAGGTAVTGRGRTVAP